MQGGRADVYRVREVELWHGDRPGWSTNTLRGVSLGAS